jgi:hypothetical protein
MRKKSIRTEKNKINEISLVEQNLYLGNRLLLSLELYPEHFSSYWKRKTRINLESIINTVKDCHNSIKDKTIGTYSVVFAQEGSLEEFETDNPFDMKNYKSKNGTIFNSEFASFLRINTPYLDFFIDLEQLPENSSIRAGVLSNKNITKEVYTIFVETCAYAKKLSDEEKSELKSALNSSLKGYSP